MSPFKDRAAAYVARVEKALDARLPAAEKNPVTLHQAMRYSVLDGGKRVRPLLCYAAGEALGLEPDALDDAACAVELIHAFSLVHDDLPAMDDDALRRGKPATHKAFGTATAILAGDALQTLAFTVLARRGNARMLQTLAEATGSEGMTGGQAMDLAAEGKQISLTELEELHRHKTGCLIRAAIRMACDAVPECDKAARDRLDRFAGNIGLAFQIRDDVLDVEGDTAVIGKTQGADIAHGKSTYPALMGLDAAKQHADELYADALAALEPFGEHGQGLRWMAGYIVQRDK
jgi:farnesyl diphosphate synthase